MTINWPGDDAVFPFCTPIIEQFEGFSAAPYRDSAGIPTIGYGTIQYPGGRAVTMKDGACTATQAEVYLQYEMKKTSAAVASYLQRSATLHQAAAMLSLAYNIGTGGFKGSTVLRKFNTGDITGSADAFLVWDKATVDGQLVVIEGLHNRRVQERALFLTPDALPAVA